MAKRLPDGSIQMADGRVVYGDSVLQAQDLCELVPILCPPSDAGAIFPGLFRGGGGRGAGGNAGFGGGGGPRGERGITGPPGPISQVQDEGGNLPLQNTLNFLGSGVSAVDNPGAGATDITINDLYAATRIVSTDPAQGTDTTIQAAVNNLPPQGGKIFVKDPQSISSSISIGDKDVVMEFAGGAVLSPIGDIEIFSFLNGLTAARTITSYNLLVAGDNTKAQTLFAFKDANSLATLMTYDTVVSGVKTVHDIQAGDVTYTIPVRVKHKNGRFAPTVSGFGNNIIAKSPSAAGTYEFGMSITFDDCDLYDMATGGTLGWSCDFDGDLIFNGTCSWVIDANTTIDGFSQSGQLIMNPPFPFAAIPVQLEMMGYSWYSTDSLSGLAITSDAPSSFTLKLSARVEAPDIRTVGHTVHFILNAAYCTVKISNGSAAMAGVHIDILSGADFCIVEGMFYGAVTATIRTAAQYGSFRGTWEGVGGNTILETAGADFNISAGSTGLSKGAGVTQVGANSKYDLTLANVP